MKNKAIVAILLAVILPLSGCSGYQNAVTVSNVLGGVLAIAQAEESQIPAQDQPAFSGFVSLGQSLHGQLNSCISSASKGVSKSGKFLACFNSFAQGLASPSELAQLRVLSPGSQSKVQLYLAGIVTGLNVAMNYFGGSQVATPTVGPAPTAAELAQLKQQVWGR